MAGEGRPASGGTAPRPAGTVIGRRYRLEDVLGEGGMGVVHRATDQILRRAVAIKEVRMPTGGGDANAQARERVLREARAAGRVHHPGAVGVLDVIDDGQLPWIVMELVEGEPLSALVERTGGLPLDQVAQIGISLAYALDAAHRLRVVHRDVKPSNVLVTGDGSARLTDFGIAVADGDPRLTRTGEVIGSPAYLSPERAQGEPGGPASDVWGLGATLYAAVEGEPAFSGATPIDVLTSVVDGRMRPAVRAGRLWPLLAAMLAPAENDRPALSDVRSQLRELAGEPPASPAASRRTAAPSRPATAPRTAPTAVVRPRPAVTPPATPAVTPTLPATPARPAAAGLGPTRILDQAPAPSITPAGETTRVSPPPGEPEASAGRADAEPPGTTAGADRTAIVDEIAVPGGTTAVVRESRAVVGDTTVLGDTTAVVDDTAVIPPVEQPGPAAGAAPSTATVSVLPGQDESDGPGEAAGPDADGERPPSESERARLRAAAEAANAARRQTERRAMVALVAIVAVLVLALVIVRLAGPDRKPSQTTVTVTTTVPTAAGDLSPAADPPISKDSTPAGPPNGWLSYVDPAGWSISYPAVWQVDASHGPVTFLDPTTGTYLRVGSNARPSSVLGTWLTSFDQAYGSQFQGYQRLRLVATDGGTGATQADLEFTGQQKGIEVHVLDRGVARGGHGYLLYFQSGTDHWSGVQALRREVYASFRPAP
jgi:hypothetical protein